MGRVHVVESNRAERLAAAFVAAVRAERERLPPVERIFAPVHVVTSSRLVEERLRRELATGLGVAAHLTFEPLEELLARVVRASDPSSRPLDEATLQGWVLSLLHDDALLDDPELERVRRYLFAVGPQPDAVDRRRAQLSARVVRLLLAQATARRAEGTGLPGWQRRLWDEIFGPEGIVVREARERGVCWVTLADFFAMTVPAALVVPGPLHLFAPAPWDPLLSQVLPRLAAAAELHVYHLHPCREEEAPAPKRRGGRAPAAQLGLAELGDPPPLRIWARPAREARRRLLEALPDAVVTADFAPPPGAPSTLRALQEDLLARAPASDPPAPLRAGLAGDDGITIRACPSLRREVEAIAADLWQLVAESERAGAPLRFDDVAILVPQEDAEQYYTHVAAVFREAGDLPHRLVDAPLARGSRVVEAALLLLALPQGPVSRQELLRLLLHPAVRARFPDVQPEDWLTLPDRLGIVHGTDRADHLGTYIDRDLFNWDQGCKRLALGAFLTGPAHGDDRPFVVGGERYLPADLPPGELDAAMGFGLLVRSILADVRFARGARLPLAEWGIFLRALLTTVVVPAEREDERALDACLRALDRLAQMPVRGAVSYQLVVELAREALAALVTTRSSHPSAGVTVAPFAPARPLPFRVIFVAGLGAGRFPGSDVEDELDARGPLAGWTAADRDRCLFLETLLAARDRLVLSYVARDVRTGDPFEPSSLLRDLLAYTEARGIFAGPVDRCARRPPLMRHEDGDAVKILPSTAAEAHAHALGRAVEGGWPPGAPLDLPSLKARLPRAALERIAEPLGLVLPTDAPSAPPPDPRPLSIAALRRFLECPLQGSAQALLGLRDAEDDGEQLHHEDEPFATAPAERGRLLRRAFLRALRAAIAAERPLDDEALRAAYEAVSAQLRLTGRRPLGVFAASEDERHLEVLRAWAERLAAVTPRVAGVDLVSFGGAEEHEEAARGLEPLLLEAPPGGSFGGAARLALVGRTSPVLRTPDGETISLVLALSAGKDLPIANAREALKGYVDALALAAARADEAPARPHRVAVLRPRGAAGRPPFTMAFGPRRPADARRALAALAADLLGGVHAYLLPCEAVFRARRGRGAVQPLTGIVAGLRDAPRAAMSTRYGPVPAIERYPIPDEEEAQRMVAARFGGFFAGRVGGDEGPDDDDP